MAETMGRFQLAEDGLPLSDSRDHNFRDISARGCVHGPVLTNLNFRIYLNLA